MLPLSHLDLERLGKRQAREGHAPVPPEEVRVVEDDGLAVLRQADVELPAVRPFRLRGVEGSERVLERTPRRAAVTEKECRGRQARELGGESRYVHLGCIILGPVRDERDPPPRSRRTRENAPAGRPRPLQRPVADETPARLKEGVRRVRPVRPLPAGPFPVPISTIDWLLSRESPAVRYVALRDVLARPAKDIERRKAWQALPRDPYVRDVLPLVRRRLEPGVPAAEFERRHDGGLWQLLFLALVGADRTLPGLERSGDILLAHWQQSFLEVGRGEDVSSDLELFSTACRTLVLLGWGDDARVVRGAEHLALRRVGGRVPPRSPASRDLLLFAALPAASRSESLQRGIDFCVERIVGSELPALLSATAPEEAFPDSGEPDLLEVLDALASVGVPRRPELERALARAASRADHRARWTLRRIPAEPVLLPLERVGELSRWVTIRGLRTMQHFLGLTIRGSA